MMNVIGPALFSATFLLAPCGNAFAQDSSEQINELVQPVSDRTRPETLAGLEQKIADKTRALETIETRLAILRDALAVGQSNLVTARAERSAEEAALAEARTALADERTALEQAKTETAEGKARLAEANGELAALTQERDDLASQVDQRKQELAQATEQLRTAETQLAAVEQDRARLNAELADGSKAKATAEQELATVQADLDRSRQLASATKAIEQQHAAATERLETLRAELARIESRRSEAETAFAQTRAAQDAAEEKLTGLLTRIEEGEKTLATNAALAVPALPAAPGVSALKVAPDSAARLPQLVSNALATAPGIPAPQSAAYRNLHAQLVDGACVLDALTASLGTVNRQTLVALIRSLGGC